MGRLLFAAALAALVTSPVSAVAAQAEPPPLAGHACGDFDSYVWAQSVYDADPAANPELDLDGDGIACPEWPPGFAPALWTTAIPLGAEPAELVRVVDGDTIEVRFEDGAVESVRLILVDTPESVSPSTPDECFGAEATAFTTAVLTDYEGDLYLERDVSDRDRFGRLLRYVRVGGAHVGETLVREGYARAVAYPPDTTYQAALDAAQREAQDAGRGLWSACQAPPTPSPSAAPTSTPTRTPTTVPPTPTRAPTQAPQANCHPSYPTVCIPPPPPDLDCGDIPHKRFTVLQPDPHRFDSDRDGIGCES